jgi:hypothetical protein
MGILSKIFGTDEAPEHGQAGQGRGQAGVPAGGRSEDEQALARYRYMLRTAPPETIEQAHEEAFARLTPEQRRMLLQQLSAEAPEAERAAAAQGGDSPQSLARMATRAEVRQPGTLERTFGGLGGGGLGLGGGGLGLGGLMAGSFLSTIAGTVVGSMIAHEFFSHDTGFAGGDIGGGHDQDPGADPGQDEGDLAADDTGGMDEGGFDDLGGDLDGDLGGDF